jgi:signal transduction histidine kinase
MVIDKYAKKLHTLASDLLTVSRIESGSFPYQFEKTNIKEFIFETVNEIVKSSTDFVEKQRKLHIDIHVSQDIDNNYVSVDKERITQVLTNIINNAIKFTEDGVIMVVVSKLSQGTVDKYKKKAMLPENRSKSRIQIKITDTGTGIPKDILPKLFTKFVTRNIKVGKEFKQGTGLGLFICKAIIKEHHGNICAYNNENGIGATFAIELPEI